MQKTQIYVHENDDGLQITYRKMWEPSASSFNEAHLTHEVTYRHTHKITTSFGIQLSYEQAIRVEVLRIRKKTTGSQIM